MIAKGCNASIGATTVTPSIRAKRVIEQINLKMHSHEQVCQNLNSAHWKNCRWLESSLMSHKNTRQEHHG
jgi:hypothetical protein